jgi:putative ABC transport system substrate-binding protein
VAGAHQGRRIRRIGVLMNSAADDPEGQARIAAFVQGLEQSGWSVGRNARIDIRWAAADMDRAGGYAAELVALSPDVILASSAPIVAALQKTTRSVPIVFVTVADPVAAGLVASLRRPGGNVTGFALFEYGISAKWLELLKEVAPQVRRAAVLRDPAIAAGTGELGAIQSVAPLFGVELFPIGLRDPGEIEQAVTGFARDSKGGVIVLASPLAVLHRHLIITLAARHHLPAVYPYRYLVADGGLISYGPDPADHYRRAVGYVDRILKGEKPDALPVQAPVKYELAINVRTAKALELTVPDALIARADQVIE